MGATINTGLAVLKKKLAPCSEDTTVLLSFGGNDCDYDWTQISENPDAEYEPHTPQPLFVESFRDAIRTIQNAGAAVAVTSLLPIDAERYMSCVLLLGRISAAAQMRPVSSSDAKSTFSISCSGRMSTTRP